MKKKICEICSKEFIPNKINARLHKYCSIECRLQSYLNKKCEICGADIPIRQGQKYRKIKKCPACTKKSYPIKTCEYCGKKFRTPLPHQKYCSEICYIHASKHYEKKCKTCGVTFTAYHKDTLYCSRECYEWDTDTPPHKRTFKKICENCGKEFQAVHAKDKFCSRDCREKFYANAKKKTAESRKCIICGKIFKTTYSKKITCSAECRKENKRFHTEIKGIRMKKCIVCGKEFISLQGRQTCSKECLKIRQNEISDNPNSFWKIIKAKAKARKRENLDSSAEKH